MTEVLARRSLGDESRWAVDRRRHVYIIGKTGMGKTTLIENMVLQDIYNGHGVAYIDPHGDTVEKMLDYIPSWRINDIVYFNPADMENPIGFNVLEAVDERHKHLVAAGLMSVFQKIWENMWSARMEYILNNTILALLDTPGSTLLGINRMYSDEQYRLSIVKNIKDPIVKQFWVMEYAGYSEKYATEAVAAVQNKIGQFLSTGLIRNIVAQVKSTIDIREIMDQKKVLFINLSKGRIGEDNSRLLGGMLVTKIQLAAMERVDMPEIERKDFYLYVDEFQNFATEAFANILSEARKYRLNLIVAHQYIAQLTDEVRDAVLGNVGTLILFRVGAPDGLVLETELTPTFTVEDIINLPKFQIYLKLMIDGVSSAPFSAATLPPIAKNTGTEEKVIRSSRERYGHDRADIEEKVMKWAGLEEGADVEAIMDERRAASGGQQKKKKHKYKCSHCAKEMAIPVKLDRSRPIYCEDCREVVSELRKTHKYDPRKDLIYDEELNVVGSVAELGSDGKWVERKGAKGDKDKPKAEEKKTEPKKEESIVAKEKIDKPKVEVSLDVIKKESQRERSDKGRSRDGGGRGDGDKKRRRRKRSGGGSGGDRGRDNRGGGGGRGEEKKPEPPKKAPEIEKKPENRPAPTGDRDGGKTLRPGKPVVFDE